MGGGSLEDELKAFTESNNIQDVFFRGYIDNTQVLELMNKAYVLAVPSYEEPFGIVALEAAYAGTCVIASNKGGLSSVIKRYRNGILFDYKIENDLEKKLLCIIINCQLRNVYNLQQFSKGR